MGVARSTHRTDENTYIWAQKLMRENSEGEKLSRRPRVGSKFRPIYKKSILNKLDLSLDTLPLLCFIYN